ncbi:MAG: choice-of-anchor I family protein, partial [Bacteroidota bacterium]
RVFDGLVAVASEAEKVDANGKVVFFDTDGTYINDVEVGVLPDMLIFTHVGDKVIVANEGEPNDDYTIDPEGSISIIDVSNGAADATVTNITFTEFNDFQEVIVAGGVRVFGPGATVAQDAEPEYIAISEDDATAFVVLQENNAVAVVDIANATLMDILPLGVKDHSIEGNGFDASNRSDAIDITTHPVVGLYLPDAIDAVEIGGETYLITANEGDSRDYDGFSEEERVADITLDAEVFPNAAELQMDENLGRLKITTTLGDPDEDGDYDILYAYGARSFTIWDTEGNIVFDSGDDFEQITAAVNPEFFNSSNDESGLKDRSDDKGPEPEAVEIVKRDGKVFALIGLERVGGIFVYDITDPANATFVNYVNNRNFEADPESPEALDLGVESIIYISAADSPNGQELVVTANEVSGTVTVFGVGEQTDNINEAIEQRSEAALTMASLAAFPNPTTDVLNLQYSIAKTSPVEVFLTDTQGRRVATIFNGTRDAGRHYLSLSTESLNLASGLYFVSIQTADTFKTLVVKVQ